MKKILFLFTGFLCTMAVAQNIIVVEKVDFCRRPQLYHGKVITVKNVVFNKNADNARNLNYQTQKIPEASTHKGFNRPTRLMKKNPNSQPHNQKPKLNKEGMKDIKEVEIPKFIYGKGLGKVFVYPYFENLSMPMIFSVDRRLSERLPKGEFSADITFKVNVKGISEISRLRIIGK
jgi:hypothetical protein